MTASLKKPLSNSPAAGLLTDTKLIKNAICTDWPAYFLGNQNAVIVNKNMQVQQIKHAKNNVAFTPECL